jgi:Glypican
MTYETDARVQQGNDLSLTDTFERFFSKLAFGLFEHHLAKSGHSVRSDSSYVNCFDDYIERSRPFEDVPSKLLRLVRRSFVVARDLAEGLKVGRDTLLSVSKVSSHVIFD